MDEMITANLGFFFTPVDFAFARYAPARTIPSPALIIPFPPVNT